MPKFSAMLPTPDTTGDFEEMCLAAGEGVGMVTEIKPAADIVQEMMRGAKEIIEGRLAECAGSEMNAEPPNQTLQQTAAAIAVSECSLSRGAAAAAELTRWAA